MLPGSLRTSAADVDSEPVTGHSVWCGQTEVRGGPVSTIFTKIIEGEIPGTFVHRDDRCVA